MKTYQQEREYIARHFKHIRRKAGWTQRQMALYLDMSRPAYNRYETGVNDAPAVKYVRALNLDKEENDGD